MYQVVSYWDKEKKQPRQRREYLGKKNPQTGKIAKVRGSHKPKYARDWGNVYLLDSLAERIGLTDTLKEVYPDRWKELLYLGIFEVAEGTPFYLFKNWSESAFVEGIRNLSSQRISEFLEDIGVDGLSREDFFQHWLKRQQDISSVLFDITSLSSYSDLIEQLEWGYNRDGESLPQINLGVVFGEPSSYPLFYNIYQGSIKDVSTLQNILIIGKKLGIKDILFILDRGFYSKKNIEKMKDEEINFLLPIPFSTALSQKLIMKHHSQLSSHRSSFLFGKQVLYYVRKELKIGKVKTVGHIYMDDKRKVYELDVFMKKLLELEEKIQHEKWEEVEDLEQYITNTLRGSKKLLNVSIEDNNPIIQRNEEALTSLINRMGKTIMITDKPSLQRNEVLHLYRLKDHLEKLFDTLKNELNDKRLRVHSSTVMEGRLFVHFISLIIHSALSKIMREKKLFKDYTIHELLFELKKLKLVEMENKKRYLTEVSKKQKEIFKEFELEVNLET